jgi:hypothetical protein
MITPKARSILDQISEFIFFQIKVNTDFEFEGITHKNAKQKNNDSILTPENWEQHKETFFTQRMETYKNSYTNNERIKLELERIENLPSIKEDYKILKDRYKNFLETKKVLPPQPIKKQKTELYEIWLSNPKITIEDFLQLGIDKGIWNEQYNIITAKGSLYGTGKSLLGNLYIALKGYAINENTDYKLVGKAFCDTFNIKRNEKIKEPYKVFSSGNQKIIKQFKTAFSIR